MKGVKESKLLDQAHREDQSSVPIGAPFLVNNVAKVSKGVREFVGTQQLESPNLNQFSAEGYDNLDAVRLTDLDRVGFYEPPVAGNLRIVEGTYRGDTGELILTRANKEQIVLRDLLRIDQLGTGSEGPRGVDAPNGEDGYDGYDGRDGDDGCEGAVGLLGPQGPTGSEGEDGPIGEQGPSGCEGPIGVRGIMGEEGRHGYEGPRGVGGPDCIGELQGAEGPAGPAFGEGVWFGLSAMAPMSVAIVGLPDDGIDSTVGAPGSGVAPTPKPPPPKPPPLPQDPPPPPEPEPEPGPPKPAPAGRVTLCRKMNRSPRDFCDASNSNWSTTQVHKMGAHRVGKAYGISTLSQYDNTAWWRHNLVLCASFTSGAVFSYEFTAPSGIIANFKINCNLEKSFEDVGGTARGTFVGKGGNTTLSVLLIGKSKRIPVWFAMTIKNSAGEVVYYTGMNQTRGSDRFSTPKEWITENNWFSNTVMQTIGDRI